ncbi:carbohydrate ABC transporter substrate-binding protein, CUT1 family [Pedococcus cremeus]|uniref:Carbohydrate ABC transporter substrate-binding protein, CUT1 family n=1 Tax=Pedococcus cremeus TaxID=587636 RepID=A0A1H9VZS7_9MICO|nr:sugar ABC transporter substrate-binding protein [Pedococcus cremeus]SES27175.1 carbohydrate ABC transporter substrate-binding protein, CUT1 family [Pedococcus cremeus]
MKRTSAIVVVTLTTTALALSSCGRDSGAATAATQGKTVSDGKATGSITVWAMGAEGEKLPELAKEFEAANPGVKVNVTAIPWDAAHDKFTTAITANQTPDVAMVGTTWMGEFAGLGALDATPPAIKKDAYFPGAWGTTEVGGTSYGVPWYVETRLVYYRTDLAEKAGITSPPTDWAGLKSMAKAMQDKAGAKWGIGLQAGGTGSWQSVMPFAWSNGAELTKDGGKAYNFNTPEMLEAVKYYQSYFTDGISDKAAPATPTTEPDFVSGKVPMFISGPWEMSAVEKVGGAGFKDKYGVMKMPVKKTSSSFVGGSDLAVFKNTKNRDSAWKFVEWLSKPDVQVKWYKLSTDLPSVKSAWDDPALQQDKKLAEFGKQLETAKAPPSFPTWEQVITSFDTEMEKVTKTGADPAAALKTVQSQAESIGTGQ